MSAESDDAGNCCAPTRDDEHAPEDESVSVTASADTLSADVHHDLVDLPGGTSVMGNDDAAAKN